MSKLQNRVSKSTKISSNEGIGCRLAKPSSAYSQNPHTHTNSLSLSLCLCAFQLHLIQHHFELRFFPETFTINHFRSRAPQNSICLLTITYCSSSSSAKPFSSSSSPSAKSSSSGKSFSSSYSDPKFSYSSSAKSFCSSSSTSDSSGTFSFFFIRFFFW
jgi:hypothetical protein